MTMTTAHAAAEPLALQPGLPLQTRLWRDANASLVVLLVSLPLNLGIALAAGAPSLWGLASAIVGGLLVGAMSGAPLRVTGPADSGIAFVAAIHHHFGLASLGIIVFMAGLIQFLAGRLALGQWFRAIAPAVIHGMLGGIGILIVASQLHGMLDRKPFHGTVDNLLALGSWPALLSAGSPHWAPLSLGVGTLLLYVAWGRLPLPTLRRLLPPALVSVGTGALVAAWMHLPVRHIDFPEHLWSAIPFGQMLSHIGDLSRPEVWGMILALAFVLSAETLLDAMAIDSMVVGHRTAYNRDLSAQGIGNMVCGLLGTMPISGVIIRSITNVRAGAQTRASCVFLGLWLLIAVTVCQPVFAAIPTACLSAVLIVVGFTMIDFKAIGHLFRISRSEAGIYVATLLAVVLHDILTGVVVGFVLSLVKLVYIFSHLDVQVTRLPEMNRVDVVLKGAATFVRLPQVATLMETLPPQAEIHLQLDEVTYIDHACLELFRTWQETLQTQGGRLVMDLSRLSHPRQPVLPTLRPLAVSHTG